MSKKNSEKQEQIEPVTPVADVPSKMFTNYEIKLPKWFLEQSVQRKKISVKQMISEGKFIPQTSSL
jgi:hypothetical protein